MADKLEITPDEAAKLAAARNKKGYSAPRPGTFSSQVKSGADVFRQIGEVESKLGATKESNVATFQRKHPIPPEE